MHPSLKRRVAPLAAVALTTAALAVGGAFWWRERQAVVSTDNAFVQADKVAVAPQVEGYVAEVLVKDNEIVRPGQLLARLDRRSVAARLAQAEANAAALQAAVRGVDDKAVLETAVIAQKAAGLESARAQARLANADMSRYGTLSQAGFVSSQRVQQTSAAAAEAQANVGQAQAALEAERRAAQSLGSAREQTVAQALAAQAEVEQARIDLGRTEIRAPIGGVVGGRAVRPGQYVRAGATLLSIVPVSEAYVVANFKETQVAHLRLGQPVEIKADAFGSQVIRGHIDSFAPATGSEFALIPVENAVGNFTKISQRIPVKIVIEPRQALVGALRPGLSIKVKVDVTRNTGASFAQAALP